MNKGQKINLVFSLFISFGLVYSSVYAGGIAFYDSRQYNMPALREAFQKVTISSINEEEKTEEQNSVDFNGDGNVDLADVKALLEAIGSADPQLAMMDLNGNGRVDFADAVIMFEIINASGLSSAKKNKLLKSISPQLLALIKSMLKEAESKAKAAEKKNNVAQKNIEVESETLAEQSASQDEQAGETQEEAPQVENEVPTPKGIASKDKTPGKGSHNGWTQGKHKGWDKAVKTEKTKGPSTSVKNTSKTVNPTEVEQAETAELPSMEATSTQAPKRILAASLDFDDNGTFDFSDVETVFEAISSEPVNDSKMDLNGNEKCDFGDVVLAYNVLKFNTLDTDNQNAVLKALAPKLGAIIRAANIK